MPNASNPQNKKDWIKINDLIYYEKNEDGMLDIQITDYYAHMLAKYGMLVHGIKNLAKLAAEDESIAGLAVTSVLVKDFAQYLAGPFHFTIDGPIDESGDEWKAHIDREELLQYFGPKE